MPHKTQPTFERRTRILVVEDEPSVRDALVRFLERAFGSATPAASLTQAKEQLRFEDFDVFVVDLGLPDGDGLDLIDSTRSGRTLIISANPDVDRIHAAGVRAVLQKPLRLTDLATQVHRLVVRGARVPVTS